ncbi:phage antirepressor KilAC domain-containing protein [Bacillus sp. S/N-304-OC-R1]|uniref:phage antirepressor n=1 Tax=Bacillus sp. S/N-304-OC-R1 TaxID=2758034 RepID=UPI001C8DE357|nr:phage antirepressor KilAC domain-containing protein [Bacillus sp. S/N-304-OC-R1]MBY0122193.1 phage antirepressor KilAC domain-containing protein [Bacillus sp. S/N-304-OC-R1]
MNELQRIFDFNGHELRMVIQNDEPWFVARDVTDILELDRTAIRRLEEDEKDVCSMHTLGGTQSLSIINESGLYELIFASRKLEAKMFKKWVKQEVLPSIRKHGMYGTPQTIENILNDPDFGIKLLTTIKEERVLREQAEQQRDKAITQQQADLPYTNFGKVVSNSSGAISIGAFAKMMYDKHGIKIGRNKMFEWLRENGYLIKKGREYNNPKQIYIEQGLFDVKPTIVTRTEGDVEKLTTLITGKGQVKLAEILLKNVKVAI